MESAPKWKVNYEKDKPAAMERQRRYRKRHRAKVLAAQRAYRKKRPDIGSKCAKAWIKNNPDKARSAWRKQSAKRRLTVHGKLLANCRNRVHRCLSERYLDKNLKTKHLIGCSVEQLKAWIESRWQTGMSWANYGAWHIDHIKAASLFDLSSNEQLLECFNYRNLQPLWAKENIAKGGANRSRFRQQQSLSCLVSETSPTEAQ